MTKVSILMKSPYQGLLVHALFLLSVFYRLVQGEVNFEKLAILAEMTLPRGAQVNDR